MADKPHKPGRGGRQYTLKRVQVAALSPGLRTVLSEYEAAVRSHEFKGAEMPEDWPEIDAYYDGRKQALLRKLVRMQQGDELVDVEELKRNFRRMARFIHNVRLLECRDQRHSDAIQALVASCPEVTEDVERIISKRRSW